MLEGSLRRYRTGELTLLTAAILLWNTVYLSKPYPTGVRSARGRGALAIAIAVALVT
jgi:hypothetical protein